MRMRNETVAHSCCEPLGRVNRDRCEGLGIACGKQTLGEESESVEVIRRSELQM